MTTTIDYGDQEFSAIAIRAIRSTRSMLDQPRRLADRLMKSVKTESGGARLQFPWKVGRHSSTTQMSVSGYNPIDLVGNPQHKSGTETWAYFIRPVLISKREETEYRGTGKILDLVKERTEDAYLGHRQELNDHFAAGDQSQLSDLNHLNGVDYTDGFLEENAVLSQGNTVHGVSKATYSSLPGFQNRVADCAGSYSANGVRVMRRLLQDIRNLVENDSDLALYVSGSLIENYGRVTLSQERYVAGQANAGMQPLMFDKYAMHQEDALPADGANTTANPISGYVIDHKHIGVIGQQGMVEKFDGFREISGHAVRAAFLHNFIQLRIDYWGTSGVIMNGNVF
jgi:hypothetical protein